MCLKKFATTLKSEALNAPLPHENEKGQATFAYGNMSFRCLNNADAITALANKIEKNHKKNFSWSKTPQKRGIKRGSIPAVIRRLLEEGDFHNAREFDALT